MLSFLHKVKANRNNLVCDQDQKAQWILTEVVFVKAQDLRCALLNQYYSLFLNSS